MLPRGQWVTNGVVWEMQDEARRVLACRRTFRARLHALCDDRCDIDAAELIYGELVANVVRYAAGSVLVQLQMRDGATTPTLIVRDNGPGLHVVPWAPRRDPYAESGRGLAIVEMLARDVAVTHVPGGGTEVRAVLPAPAA